MALIFIGKGPDVLPIPEELELDPRRYVGSGPPTRAEQKPPCPTRIRIRYTLTDKDGRVKFVYAEIEPIPEACTGFQSRFFARVFHAPSWHFRTFAPDEA